MNSYEAIRLISRLSYKPGWELTAYEAPHDGGVILRFGKDEPDSEDPTKGPRPLAYTAPISREKLGFMDEEALLRFAFDTVVKREVHEVEEWLRLDGQPLFEPHPERWHRGILGDGSSLQQPIPRERLT